VCSAHAGWARKGLPVRGGDAHACQDGDVHMPAQSLGRVRRTQSACGPLQRTPPQVLRASKLNARIIALTSVHACARTGHTDAWTRSKCLYKLTHSHRFPPAHLGSRRMRTHKCTRMPALYARAQGAVTCAVQPLHHRVGACTGGRARAGGHPGSAHGHTCGGACRGGCAGLQQQLSGRAGGLGDGAAGGCA